MFLFYNDLRETGKHYGIYLKPYQELRKNTPVYEEGFFTTPAQIAEMKRRLFQKLKQPGVLPCEDKRLQLLILSHKETYDGFALVLQILMPYVPVLLNGKQIGRPTWASCKEDIYLLQAHLSTFYATKEASKQTYTEMEKSRIFLIICASSSLHKETATYYHRS